MLLTATGPRRRLWERRRGDDDALVLRIGTGVAVPTSLRVTSSAPGDPRPAAPDLLDVPIVLPLREIGVLGLAGDRSSVRAVARWLVGQATVLHSPRDVGVVLLVDPAAPSAAADWGWLRWLPHAAPAGGHRSEDNTS